MELFSFYNYSKQQGDSDKNDHNKQKLCQMLCLKKKRKKTVQSELINAAAQTTLIQNY